MPRLLTQSQFSRRTRYSRARICQLVKMGIISTVDGLINAVQAEEEIKAHLGHLHRHRTKRVPAQTEICRECSEVQTDSWFCSKLNLTISKGGDGENRKVA